MIKYFIEREDGKWLGDLDETGCGITTDPLKAWIFDDRPRITNNPGTPGITGNTFQLNLQQDASASCGFIIIDFRDLVDLIKDFLYEETGIRYRASKQEFIEHNGEVLGHISGTNDQSFIDMLITGQSRIKITQKKI